MINVINTYKEFLDALEDGVKNVTVTSELYSWLSENLRETYGMNSKTSMNVYGVTVHKEGRK